jgi:hypothetical protein
VRVTVGPTASGSPTATSFFVIGTELPFSVIQVLKSKAKKEKVKQSLYSPGQALRVPAGRGSQISRQSAHEGGKVGSPKHRPPLPLRKYFWYSFLLEAESNPGP